MKTLKKVLCLVLASIFLSANAMAYNIGDVIGTILSTDIVAYVAFIPTVSYNIAGRTAIIAERLKDFGLDVVFDEATRVLTISRGSGIASTYSAPPSASTLPVGTPVGKVLYTDITTNFEGTHIDSFNIGGLTCVYADDFAKLYGTYVWDEDNRTVHVTKSGYQAPTVTKKSAQRQLGSSQLEATRDNALARWGSPEKSSLIANRDGTFYTVEAADFINIEKYDSSFNLISSNSLPYELPIFGDFYSGNDYNYIVFGQENNSQDNSREVLRLVIYDKNFVKLREVAINNCKTTVPFDASNCSIAENDRYLMIHTSRSQYADANGNRPQTQLSVIIDKNGWKQCNLLGQFQPNHTSHALNGLVKAQNDRFMTLDLSDAAPSRGLILRAIDFSGNVFGEKNIYHIGGNAGANCTGVMTGGFEVSSAGYLAAVNAIDQSTAAGYTNTSIQGTEYENRDVLLLWAKKDTWETKLTCLAKYSGSGYTAGVPKLVPLSDGNYMVLWSVFANGKDKNSHYALEVCYTTVDANGNQTDSVRKLSNAKLSDGCQPVEVGGNVIWYVNTQTGRDFYSLKTDSARQMIDGI